MKKFKVYFGLGYNGAKWDGEIHEFKNGELATDYAYEMAVQEYDSRAVNDDGYRSVSTIMEQENLTEQEAEEEFENERMDTIDYYAEEV